MSSSLTLLIPCYNEAERLKECLPELLKWSEQNKDLNHRVLFINDGSSDGSEEVIKAMAPGFTVKSLEKNMGKGAAVAYGVSQVETAYLLVMDADLSTSLECIRTYFEIILTGKQDLVCGNRFHPLSKIDRSLPRSVSSYGFYFLSHALHNFRIQDTQLGFKLFKTEVARDLFHNLKFPHFSFDLEILKKAEEKYLILELPVIWTEKEGSKVDVFKDGLNMIVDILILKKQGP